MVLEIGVTPPISTHAHDVNVVGLDILAFLPPGIFGNHKVDVSHRFEHLSPDLVRVEALLALGCVEFIGGERDDEIITQRSC